jgi:hypothetical protein
MRAALLALALLLACAASVAAQTPIIILPATSQVTFTASSDHTTIGLDGNPLLTGYTVTSCLKATPTTCLPPVDVHKPTPNAANVISVTGTFSGLVPNTVYQATVAAYGPGGTSPPSTPSNPFGAASSPAAVVGAVTVIR